jgi:hypothetical protein
MTKVQLLKFEELTAEQQERVKSHCIRKAKLIHGKTLVAEYEALSLIERSKNSLFHISKEGDLSLVSFNLIP